MRKTNKKADMSIEVIVIAVIALVVLVVLIVIFLRGGANLNKGTSDCAARQGVCAPSCGEGFTEVAATDCNGWRNKCCVQYEMNLNPPKIVVHIQP